MISRRLLQAVFELLRHFPTVALLGPRQVGKTTLAKAIADGLAEKDSLYLDLERQGDRYKLEDPEHFLSSHRDKLVILDEIHNMPDLFREMRALIDEGDSSGSQSGRFLVLGSASSVLLKQTSESLAGRIAYVELTPFDVQEVGATKQNLLWLRGGFPGSLLAQNEELSATWRENFIKNYVERDIQLFGPRVAPAIMLRFWTMLAGNQGYPVNKEQLAKSLGVSGVTVARYLDLMEELFLVRRLRPYHANVRKRLVKAPKVYVRDSGILHTLLELHDKQSLLNSRHCGHSWEGFAVENILRCAPQRTKASYYRTTAGAEMDLVLELPGNELWAMEIKLSESARTSRGFWNARNDLRARRCLVVHAGSDCYSLTEGVEVIGLARLCAELLRLKSI